MRLNYPKPLSKQTGSLLVLAIFIMTVVLLLALTVYQVLNSSQQTIVYEVYGAKAYNAAESGIEHNLTVLFPTAGSGVCDAAGVSQVFTSGGLANCQYQTQCQLSTYEHLGQNISYYRIESLGSCQVGDIIVNRKTFVDAKSSQ